MEDVREYLHLYIGQQFVMKITNPLSFYKYTATMTFEVNALKAAYDKGDNHIDPILILRSLDSMTEEEAKEYEDQTIESIEDSKLITHEFRTSPEETVKLLKAGFWLFGDEAFDKGLIIDSKTLNKEV